jgi:hypothetical protein
LIKYILLIESRKTIFNRRHAMQTENIGALAGAIIARANAIGFMTPEDRAELERIREKCPHHGDPKDFKRDGERCEECGEILS